MSLFTFTACTTLYVILKRVSTVSIWTLTLLASIAFVTGKFIGYVWYNYLQPEILDIIQDNLDAWSQPAVDWNESYTQTTTEETTHMLHTTLGNDTAATVSVKPDGWMPVASTYVPQLADTGASDNSTENATLDSAELYRQTYQAQTIRQLKKLASAHKVTGYSDMRKAELVEALVSKTLDALYA